MITTEKSTKIAQQKRFFLDCFESHLDNVDKSELHVKK